MPKNRKVKPLLSETGILHLQNSFVHPSEESGLLSTVGGNEDSHGLVLAPNYGYGIEASKILEKNKKGEAEFLEKLGNSKEQTSEKPPEVVIEENNADSVADLVRSIGGAKNAPISMREIFDDRIKQDETKEERVMDTKETEDFYASIGIKTANDPSEADQPKESELTIQTHIPVSSQTEPVDERNSIAEFYKDYNRVYHYSVAAEPYGDKRLEFGLPIVPDEEMEVDQNIIELAQLAQRAKQAMEAAAKRAMKEAEKVTYDPLPMEIVPSTTAENLGINDNTTLNEFWNYVKDDPHDFNRWTYLIRNVELQESLDECRKAYSAFLPLFPYCFGYWKRFAELEKMHHFVQRSLKILESGLEFIPLSVDMWLSYITLFSEINSHLPNYGFIVRKKYEKALKTVGMEFRSDAIWESYIQWEMRSQKLRNAFSIYKRLIQTPTRLYNRHWDDLKALIRDHHPRDYLSHDEYELYRRKGCKILKLKYKEEPEIEPGEIYETTKPEDQLMTYLKDKLVGKLSKIHDKCELETDKRWDFEDKIKRPYFHIQLLDVRDIRNWEEYLDYEISLKNLDRIVLLFERCLISCAQYEYFWCKYARYLETHFRDPNSPKISFHFQRAKMSVEISKKDTEEEEVLINTISDLLSEIIDTIEEAEDDEEDVKECIESILNIVSGDSQLNHIISGSESEEMVRRVSPQRQPRKRKHLSGHSDSSECPPKYKEFLPPKEKVPEYDFFAFLNIPSFPIPTIQWHEIVRDVYKRAAIVHCPKKPAIRLQWAAFEEEIGNVEQARELILHVLKWYPDLLVAKSQLIELERRIGNYDEVTQIYEQLISRVKSKEEFSILSLKFSRFLHKECGKTDKALGALRKAIKNDKGNPNLYNYVYELCYTRYPSDKKGAVAALDLALLRAPLSNQEKLSFLKKKVLFLQEHGELRRYRDTLDELHQLELTIKKEQEEEEKWKEFDRKLKERESQMCLQAFPVPSYGENQQHPVPIEFDSIEGANYNEITEVGQLGPVVEVYKKVAPPEEFLNTNPNYGYDSRHPDQKLRVEMAQKEYEKLESRGIPEELKDENYESSTPKKMRLDQKAPVPFYLIPPRNACLERYLGGPTYIPNHDESNVIRLQAPIDVNSLPNLSAAINVPEAFVKDGGELCLSDTIRGFSNIRYWPSFFSMKGNTEMFRAIRRGIKWHQKQVLTNQGRMRHLNRLVSWLGPCNFTYSGMTLKACEDWPREVIDLLHRVNKLTKCEFNCCFLNLFRSGHDSIYWHTEADKTLGSNPPIACITLGNQRTIELKKRGQNVNFVRMPLDAGSLFLMEGATQADWVHQFPKDPSIKEETIYICLKVVHAIENVSEEEIKMGILTSPNSLPVETPPVRENSKVEDSQKSLIKKNVSIEASKTEIGPKEKSLEKAPTSPEVIILNEENNSDSTKEQLPVETASSSDEAKTNIKKKENPKPHKPKIIFCDNVRTIL